jgi:hypothetical protein
MNWDGEPIDGMSQDDATGTPTCGCGNGTRGNPASPGRP